MTDMDGVDEGMVCVACSYPIASFGERMQHYKTEWHRYNVKRRCANLAPITQEAFDTKLSALRKSKDAVVLKCDACSKTFKTQTSFDQHVLSNKHKKQAAKLQADPLDQRVPVGPSHDTDVAMQSAAPVEPAIPGGLSDMKGVEHEDQEQRGDGNGEATGAEEEEEEPVGIPPGHCLFCARDFGSDINASLTHMLKEHGFFIPYIELLHDMDGLLSYLGEKVGVGHMCLYCNGRGRAAYPSVHAVQQHMVAKHHCKIRFEADEDDEEFMDFYNFPTEDDEDRPASDEADGNEEAAEDEDREQKKTGVSSQALISAEDADASRPTSGPVGRNIAGELQMGDGRVLGHRSLQVYYRQNLRPSRNQELIDSLALSYKSLVPQYPKEHKVRQRQFIHQSRKNWLRVGVNANKLQHHFRSQIQM